MSGGDRGRLQRTTTPGPPLALAATEMKIAFEFPTDSFIKDLALGEWRYVVALTKISIALK